MVQLHDEKVALDRHLFLEMFYNLVTGILGEEHGHDCSITVISKVFDFNNLENT